MSILNKYINKDLIFLNLELSQQEELLKFMGQKLIKTGNVKETFIQAVVEREKKYPTGLQIMDIGVALPHSDIEYVNTPTIAMAVLKEPVGFYSMENNEKIVPVNVIFMLAINDGEEQLKLLQELMSLIQSQETMKKIIDASTKEEILNYLNS